MGTASLDENFYQLRIIPLAAGKGQRLDVLRRLILLHPVFRSGIVRKKQLVSFAIQYHLGEGCVMTGFKSVGSLSGFGDGWRWGCWRRFLYRQWPKR